ncbi:hypothetical protein BUALT_Bualt06G0125700 [Buddleja alternifolia]|uniref:Uncharacterized protein n=1 Tax=Buddleja alternifolia TaxID=168488 RepID=A0AAV6XQJ4_9LAMI|nr:hypothetical protein BUALT_Bualt06G0125700 [Buddleja alternifolia]
MACWSAENATKAYLRTMRMGKSAKEPNGAEFISALAAGNNVQFMVVACGGAADSTTLALAAAAQQTGGRIICILRTLDELNSSKITLGANSSLVEFVIGDAKNLLLNNYKDSDFIAIDCNLEKHESIISALQENSLKHDNAIVLGYNAFCKETWRESPLRTQLLPIGEGLLLTRIKNQKHNRNHNSNKKNWIVKVDKCTGEEHVFRVRSSVGRVIRA